MANPNEEVNDDDNPFSVNDWDIEKGIFNLVIALVQQRTQRMDATVARESVIDFLKSLIAGLDDSEENLDEKIKTFIKQQRIEDNEH